MRAIIPRSLRRRAALLGARCLVAALLAAILLPSLHPSDELIDARIGTAAILTARSEGLSVVSFLLEKTSLREKRDVPNFWISPRLDRAPGSMRHADALSPAAGERESLASHLIYTLTTSSRL